jgi:tetratricopeptide (TPR) repeat protein
MADKTLIIKEAQKYLSKGQIDKAIAEWEKLVRESPDGNTYNTVGDLYLKKGDRKNAIESFHKAASFFRDEGFMLKALALFKKVLNLNPADSDALIALGQLSEEKGLATDAIKYYLAAADSLSKEGKKDRLLEIYQKIIALSPSNVPLRNKVAEIFLKEGLKSDAVKEYISIARLFEEKGDFEKTRDYLLKVIDLQPLNKEAVMRIGDLYEKKGEIQKAIKHMREATVLFHQDTEILLKHAELTFAGGLTDEARDFLGKITELEPDNMGARKILAEIYLKEGAREKAWTEYLPVVDEMIMHEKYGDAVELLERFKDVDPLEAGKRLVSLHRHLGENDSVVSELLGLGDVLMERDLQEDALNRYREALEMRPDDGFITEKINELTRKQEAVEEEAAAEEGAAGEAPGGDKTAEEIFMEVDVFARYGLVSEAIKMLEALKVREPRNIEVHTRLKNLYSSASEKESAVSECLVLSELYKRLGDSENSEAALKEAWEISPDDPRLAEREFNREGVEAPHAAGGEEEPAASGSGAPDMADYEEDIAEADFYAKQGLVNEATTILERVSDLFPGNQDIRERLANLSHAAKEAETGVGWPEAGQYEYPAPGDEADKGPEEEKEQAAPPAGQGEYEDFVITDRDLVEAEEMPEPSLDDDVLEIFHEFKRGLAKELGEEDSETHYNLGIAYKEMGLIDDAIKEFQVSREDPKRFVSSSTMLGVCYGEKGLHSLAIDVLQKALQGIQEKDESYWAVKYDLAEAYEKDNNPAEALNLYTEVYGWNARFRDVSEKMDRLKSLAAEKAGAEKGEEKEKDKEKPKMKKDRVSYL